MGDFAMLGSKSTNRIIFAGATAALALGAAFAASAQIQGSGNGKGPVTPPQDPGVCLAKNMMNPNKWSICGVTPPKNRDISVVSSSSWVLKIRISEPGGTNFQRTLTFGQSASVPIVTTANATIHVDWVDAFVKTRQACEYHSADHGSGNITVTVKGGVDSTATDYANCTIAP